MPTARSEAATATSASRAATAAPALDLGRRATDESGDVAPRREEDRVHAGPLELGDLFPVGGGELRDRELARRNALQELEDVLERRAALAVAEQEDLRVDAIERPLQLLVARDRHDRLEAEPGRLLVERHERLLVACGEDAD